MARIKHYVRTNPDTHDTEFSFQFRHGERPIGWFTLDQVVEASNAAVESVTRKQFDALVRSEFPGHDYNSADQGP